MKSIFRKITFIAAIAVTILMVSCSKEVPETYVAVKMTGVELKSAPDAKSSAVSPAEMGEIFRYIDFPADGWVKVRNIATGNEGYLDTLAISRSNFPLLAPELAEQEVDEAYLVNTESTDICEQTVGWSFWKVGDGDDVAALCTESTVYTDGRIRGEQYYYKGVTKNGYLLLTEQVEYGEETGEKLEKPIIVYEDIVDQHGVYIDGRLFMPANSGAGFDTDDWE